MILFLANTVYSNGTKRFAWRKYTQNKFNKQNTRVLIIPVEATFAKPNFPSSLHVKQIFYNYQKGRAKEEHRCFVKKDQRILYY